MLNKPSDRFARYVPTIQLFAARLVLFHQKVAERLGLTATEFKCLRLIALLGPLPMTTLAQESGLQLGTVSGLIEKMEAQGLVERARDPSDKRRVLLKASGSISEQASTLYRELGGLMRQELDGYSDSEFELIMRFLTQTGEALATSIKAPLNREGRKRHRCNERRE
ncbi:MarR family transcriptional regulator [Acetobacter sacchari]|uniref:MarR family transcriptional regulator n=1 Tax=Acetobacter sacchari TaxID=2661687 RepID=A0ABS3LWD7_9PROT|nr:MarR family transcriptional regulator [Acetobacter sacchari]MBO1360227.1 MarR family transcriptional regulator [Acetobacter sacchari]